MKIRHSLKKITALLLMVALVATTGVGMATDNGIVDELKQYDHIFEKQAPALEAYQVLYTTFTVHDDGNVTYPDDYAGAWIDDFKLHIAVTPDRRETSGKYQELLKEYDCVVYKTAAYSLNELDNIRSSLFDEMGKELQIISHHVDMETNKINFGLLEVDEKKFSAALSASRTGRTTDSGKPITGDLFILSKGEEPIHLADLHGGTALQLGSNTNSGFTAGVCGTFTVSGRSYNGFITSAHGLSPNLSVRRAGGSSQLGIVSLLQYVNGGIGDWAAIQVTNGDTITNRLINSKTGGTIGNIVGTSDDLPVGAFVQNSGKESGITTSKVTAQNEAVQPLGTNIIIRGLTRVEITSGSYARGDSGGPFYVQITGGFSFAGVLSAGTTINGVQTLFFTPHVRFKNSFTVKTS